MKPGYDLLGAAHNDFPFLKILREIQKECPVGWFWDTFGPSQHIFETLLKRGYQCLRIQVDWSNHTIVSMDKLRRNLKEIDAVYRSTAHGPVRLYISPSCEHSETDVAEVRKRLELVKELVPYATPVNNPWTGAVVKGYLLEKHGSNPDTCDLASTDGTNIYDINAETWVKKYGNRTHPCFLWGYRFNLREIGDPGQNPPPISLRKAAPDMKYFKSIERLSRPPGTAPKVDFNFTRFAAPNIYKTHAEDDQEENESTPDEPRENRPVLIIKPDVPFVNILASNGKSIGKLPYFGSYADGFNRYYSGIPGGVNLYGFEIAEKAKKVSGSEFVYFEAGNKKLGPVHPAFRAGKYRE